MALRIFLHTTCTKVCIHSESLAAYNMKKINYNDKSIEIVLNYLFV